MSAHRISAITLCLVLLAACATNSYRRIGAEHVGQQDDAPIPLGVVEDAARIGNLHYFDDAAYRKIAKAVLGYQSNRSKALEEVREAICDGKRARTIPSLSVNLILPKDPPGLPLDTASHARTEFMRLTRIYLKKWFLDEAADPRLLTDKFNSDFGQYKENVIDTGGERKWANRRFGVVVPFAESSKRPDVEKYYRELTATILVPDMEHTDPVEWFPSRYYVATFFPKDHAVILAPKVSPLLIGGWGFEKYGTEMTSMVTKTGRVGDDTSLQPFASEEDTFNLRSRAAYTVAENAWKLDDGTVVHPLLLSVLEDLALLKREFTFVLPKSVIESLFSTYLAVDQQYYGRDYQSGKFSAKLARDHSDAIWSRFLYNQTEVMESAQRDGSTKFTIKTDFTLFCTYAVPLTAIQTP